MGELVILARHLLTGVHETLPYLVVEVPAQAYVLGLQKLGKMLEHLYKVNAIHLTQFPRAKFHKGVIHQLRDTVLLKVRYFALQCDQICECNISRLPVGCAQPLVHHTQLTILGA